MMIIINISILIDSIFKGRDGERQWIRNCLFFYMASVSLSDRTSSLIKIKVHGRSFILSIEIMLT